MRWIWFLTFAALGVTAVLFGLLVPAHLRAVDVTVLHRAGINTPDLVAQALALVAERNLGAAQLLQLAAQKQNLWGREKLDVAVGDLAQAQPVLQRWGSQPYGRVSAIWSSAATTSSPEQGPATSEPLTDFLARSANRRQVLDLIESSPNPVVQELFKLRSRTNTVVFSPSQSSAGQALDVAICVCGLLLEAGHLNPKTSREVFSMSADANRGGDSMNLEQTLLSFLSLGQRLNWGQLVVFVANIEDAETLRRLAELARRANDRLPVLFAAVLMSEQPAAVAEYLMKFSETGLADLGSSLRFGTGGVRELLRRKQQLYEFKPRLFALGYDPFGSFIEYAASLDLRTHWLALPLKWVLYLVSGFFVSMAINFKPKPTEELAGLPNTPRFHLLREFLFALGFLLVVLLASEPFLAQGSQKMELPFRVRLPTVGGVIPVAITSAPASLMNQVSLLTLLLFFVIQALIYTACRIKLAEIRRQQLPPRIKLKLLENEDHLFDAGIYLGFVGTIISLILVSLGIIKPSLMAAYSSTSFGIIFVSAFKIFSLRPLRRKLLLEAEAEGDPSVLDPSDATNSSVLSP